MVKYTSPVLTAAALVGLAQATSNGDIFAAQANDSITWDAKAVDGTFKAEYWQPDPNTGFPIPVNKDCDDVVQRYTFTICLSEGRRKISSINLLSKF